jgi:hypothetical protein
LSLSPSLTETHWRSEQEVGRLQDYLPRINGQPVATG